MTLQEYAKQHPFEYAEKAAKANETGKKLTMDKDVLILEDLAAPCFNQIRAGAIA